MEWRNTLLACPRVNVGSPVQEQFGDSAVRRRVQWRMTDVVSGIDVRAPVEQHHGDLPRLYNHQRSVAKVVLGVDRSPSVQQKGGDGGGRGMMQRCASPGIPGVDVRALVQHLFDFGRRGVAHYRLEQVAVLYDEFGTLGNQDFHDLGPQVFVGNLKGSLTRVVLNLQIGSHLQEQ